MRILTINYEYPPIGGGGGIAHKVLVDEWKKHHEVLLLTTRYKGQHYTEYVHGMRVYRAPCLRRLQSVSEVHALVLFLVTPIFWLAWLYITRKRIDVVNAQFAIPSGVIGVIGKYFFRVPLVVSIHGGDIYDPSKHISPHRYRFTRMLVSWVLSRADQIIAQSTNTAENAKKYYRFHQNIEIIPLPITRMEDQHIENDTPVYTFISIGRLVERKRFSDLIDAFADVHATHPEVSLCIIGRGPLEQDLRAQIKALGLQNQAYVRTDVDDRLKMQLLARASCYVLSSSHEGYGIVLQEAMSAGLPIVATNNGGQTDFLFDHRNALLCAPQDVSGLSRAMKTMIEHPELGKQFIAQYDQTLALFDPKRIAQRTIDIFKQLL